MKSLLVSLVLLSGCVTSGLKSLETKYLPGECLKLTEETIARDFTGPGEAEGAKLLDLKVFGITENGYVILLKLNLLIQKQNKKRALEYAEARTIRLS